MRSLKILAIGLFFLLSFGLLLPINTVVANQISIIGSLTSTISTQQTVDTAPIWQVGDWVSYESIRGFLGSQYDYTVIEVTPDYVEFMFEFSYGENISNTVKINTTVIDDLSYNIINLFTAPFSFNTSVFEGFLEVNPFPYKSHALIHIDGNPTVIPVTGVAYEYFNISISEEASKISNYSVQIETHDPTGILVNTLVLDHSNATMSFSNFSSTTVTYSYLIDSHGVFESLEEIITESVTTETSETETTTTKKTLTEINITAEAPYAFEIIFISLIAVALFYSQKRRNK